MAYKAQLAMIGPEIDSKKAIMESVCAGCLFRINASSARFRIKNCVVRTVLGYVRSEHKYTQLN